MSRPKGSKLAPEHIEKIRLANTGRKASVETREKLRKSHIGYKASEVTRARMSKALMGHEVTAATRAKIGKANYRGSMQYSALHMWIKTQLGQPKKCEHCYDQDAKRYEWANISSQYLRDLSDWRRLCVLCHRIFDNTLPPRARNYRPL